MRVQCKFWKDKGTHHEFTLNFFDLFRKEVEVDAEDVEGNEVRDGRQVLDGL